MAKPSSEEGETAAKPKGGLFSRVFGRKEAPAAPPPSTEEPLAQALEQERDASAGPFDEAAPQDVTEVDEALPDAPFETEAPPQADPSPLSFAPMPPIAEGQKRSWWTRLREGLARSSNSIGAGLIAIFTKRKLDSGMLDDLEDVLIRADLGVATAARIAQIVGKGRYDKNVEIEEVKDILATEVERVLGPYAKPLDVDTGEKPFVILVVGVNGSGKTTTIGKLASQFSGEGRKVLLAAGDTFRAAAVMQLRIWGERLSCPVIYREQGADASALAFDAVKAARERGDDVVLIDTAGRLQNRAELMAELDKIIRVVRKVDESAPHAVLLVLDATVGQNALSQVEIFGRVAGVTGLVMTKLDGTARGGILVAITDKFHLPIHYIGVGETAGDLEPFTAREFARAIAGIEG
ncbi:signal recognition particle-docking protein FtsY [Methylocapsa palsarum]|uniref:Signal recognition particle receptor FtsY n=1 Tax=Methylocapsa palsarum TaxID=1612308 RepID=A0A1I3VRH8_9HYPH|nr:signal recognition particle-docking protein FtsY [Methylocapsa palsarum]SFJ97749.1 fused signal recognition particle receptor [Methylocapsa palsarum]